MRSSVTLVRDLFQRIRPADDLEAEHCSWALGWLHSTDDVFRRIRPATPSPHLVSYVVPVRPDGAALLGDHILSGLWLPPGGHVEPDEHPVDTATREAAEELGLTGPVEPEPVFATVTPTVGTVTPHLDVSLWFVLPVAGDPPLLVDPREFRTTRWWYPADVMAAAHTGFDPHLARFLAKWSAIQTPGVQKGG